jgi:hypothetical protein
MVQPAKRKLRTALAGTLLLLGFFLLGTEHAAAQSYYTLDEAQQVLKDEGHSLYTQLLNETPGTTNYNQLFARVRYYDTIRTQLEQGVQIPVALISSRYALCHPTTNADCKPLAQAQVELIIEDTRSLLTN